MITRIPAPYHRQMPSRAKDGVVRHWIEAKVGDLKEEFPDGPNPRDPKIDKALYKQIRRSLADPESIGHTGGAFGYRHSGLTLIARSVHVQDKVAELVFGPDGGLVNGGHSHALIRDVLEQHNPDEYVMLEVLTGVADELVPEIAEGRNTSLQVKRTSLADLAGSFDGLKESLDRPDEVVWHEGDTGSLKAEHLIAMVTAFDPELYDSTNHPVDVYRKVTGKFDLIKDEPNRIARLAPIVQDIVDLFHVIVAETDVWKGVTDKASHGKPAGLPFLEHPKKPRMIPLYSSIRDVEHPMKYAAALVFTSAFRYLIEIDDQGKKFGEFKAVRWRGHHHESIDFWREHGHVLMRTFYTQLNQAGRNLNACVRSDAVWSAVYNQLIVLDLQAQK